MNNSVKVIFLLIACILSISCTSKRTQRQHLEWAEYQDDDTIGEISKDKRNVKIPVSTTNSHESKYSNSIDLLLECKCDMANTKLLIRDGYIALYSLDTHCPVYVSWKLTKDRVVDGVPRCKTFFPDDEIEEKDRVVRADYNGSGWSRGHMCPAADNKDSQLRMEESCLMTNICPQDMGLNSGRWNDLENKCRNQVRKGDVLYIICGPLFSKSSNDWIGNNVKIAIPDAFYKVVYVESMNGNKSMHAYIMPNADIRGGMEEYGTSVDFVEEMTGIDFFSSLPDDIENELESISNINSWK